jgi:hypothetical protein
MAEIRYSAIAGWDETGEGRYCARFCQKGAMSPGKTNAGQWIGRAAWDREQSIAGPTDTV